MLKYILFYYIVPLTASGECNKIYSHPTSYPLYILTSYISLQNSFKNEYYLTKDERGEEKKCFKRDFPYR